MAKKRKYADSYTKKAQKKGFPARSVFKLEHMDKKHRLLRPGMKVLDLGCAPGSWLKYAAQKVGPNGLVIGIDLSPPDINIPKNALWLTGDAKDLQDELETKYGQGSFDIVLSDMAPSTSGMKDVDHLRSVELAELALNTAKKMLKNRGNFIAKVFQGEDFENYVKKVKTAFKKISLEKPAASRSDSREIFVVGLGMTYKRPSATWLEHTADMMLECKASSLEELFETAATALVNVMTNPCDKGDQINITIKASGESLEQKLVSFLNEIIFQVQSKGIVFKHFYGFDFKKDGLTALADAIVCNQQELEIVTEIKAATYHNLEVKKDASGLWHTKIVFDV